MIAVGLDVENVVENINGARHAGEGGEQKHGLGDKRQTPAAAEDRPHQDKAVLDVLVRPGKLQKRRQTSPDRRVCLKTRQW